MPRLALLGVGHLGGNLLKGLIDSGYDPEAISALVRAGKLTELENRYPVRATADPLEAVEEAELVILAVRPNQLPELLGQIAGAVRGSEATVVSLAAGFTLDMLANWLPNRIVRAMPNTAASLGMSATGLVANSGIPKDSEVRKTIERVFSGIGISVWLPSEEQLGVVTALCGCGPAFFFQLEAELSSRAIAKGLDPKTAELLASATLAGAGALARESGAAAERISHIALKGGVTEAALKALRRDGILTNIIEETISAAVDRNSEMAEQLKQSIQRK